MDREDIIRMARECQFAYYYESGDLVAIPQLERFAALVAAHEREACAKVCEANVYEGYVPPEDGAAASYWDNSAIECAAAIRARGEK